MTISIKSYRAMMAKARIDSVGVPGIYLDRSPTGSGKSYADMAAIQMVDKSIVLAPTHENCTELWELFNLNRILAEAYPPLDEDHCNNFSTALDCIDCGLSVSAAVCPTCPLREGCLYIELMKKAENADHRIATHSRASRNLTELTSAADFVSIHEEPINVIKPTADANHEEGFNKLIEVAGVASHIAWGLSAASSDTLRAFYHTVKRTANRFRDELMLNDQTRLLQLSDFVTNTPHSAEAILYRAILESKIRPPADTTRIVLAAVQGRLKSVTVRLDTVSRKGGKTETKRSLQGVWSNEFGDDKAVWFCDATSNRDELAEILGRPVIDMTPGHRLQLRQPIVQIPLDVTKQTTPQRIIAMLESILAACLGFDRIGVITHREHCPLIEGTAQSDVKLSPESQARIAKVKYYRSGAGRGSNAWYTECDLLIVLGTPRVPPAVVRTRLIQAGRHAAAECTAEEAGWGPDYWLAKTISGGARQIMFRTYRDHRWHAAQNAIVASEIKQAVGRGRGLLDSGIPVVAVTTQPLGYRVVDHDPYQPTPSEQVILIALEAIGEEKLRPPPPTEVDQISEVLPTGTDTIETASLSEVLPNKYYLGTTSLNESDDRLSDPPVFASEIATRIDKTPRHVLNVLKSLEECGLVRHVGQRGGWITSGGTPPVLVKRVALGAGGNDGMRQGGAA